jgi:hypothetical protein
MHHEGFIMSIALIFLVIALILAILAAFNVGGPIGLFPAAFAFYIGSLLVGKF